MPDWMQTLLTVAAFLVVIYLVAVLIEMIAVLVLRREYQPMQRSIELAQHDIREARKRIDQLAPFIESGAKEPPFDALYAQARDLLRRANESVREAQRQLDAATRNAIPELPLGRVFLLAPVAREIAQRIHLRRGAKTAAIQLTAFNETFDRIDQIQADIRALPRKEQDALNSVRQRSVDASAAIEAEARPQLPLSAERDTLRQVNGIIAQMGSLLADRAPTEAAVVAAHGLRLRAEAQLQTLEGAVQGVAGARVALATLLATAGDDLTELQDKIAGEAGAGMIRNRQAGDAAQMQARIAETRRVADAGDYGNAKAALDDFRAAFADMQSRRAQVQQAREDILAFDAKAQQRMSTLKQWMDETPARFDLDLTRSLLLRLEAIGDELKALAPSEDLDAMQTATALNAGCDDLFGRATMTRHDFEQQHAQFEEIAAIVNGESVPAMAMQAWRVGDELALVNTAYWGDLALSRIASSADALVAQWDAAREYFLTIKESELPAALARLHPVREQFNAVGAMHADALNILIAVDADKLQAQTGLHDDVIESLLAAADEIERSSPSLAQASASLLARSGELRRALQTPAPNYREIAAGAQQLRSDAQAYIAGHNKQRLAARALLDAMHERMVGLRMRLVDLNDDARIDFAGWTAPAVQQMDAWMSRRDALQTLALDGMQDALHEGDSIIVDAGRVLDDAVQVSRRQGERGDALRTALAELNGVMSSARAGLSAMSDLGSARWGETMLDDARKPMIDAVERMAMLEQPQQPLSPEAALAAMDEAEHDVQLARTHADAHLAEISSRLGRVEDQRHVLAQALAVAEDAVQDDAQLQQKLQEVRLQVGQLQLRSAEAASYAEAQDGLAQAVLHAQRFAARVVGI